MTTRALQIDLLLDPLIDPTTGALCAGYTAYFYAAGTSNAKNVWTEKEKTNPYTSYTLDSAGKALLYGDGIYKIIVKNTDGTAVLTLDNIKVQATSYSIRSVTGATTATPDDDVIIANGTFTITLGSATYPAPSSFERPLTIINSGAGAVTLDPYSTVQIDDAATYPLAAGDQVIIIPDADGNAWRSSLETAITGRTQLTTPAPGDSLLIEDVSESGDNNKYITAANLLKVHYLSGYASLSAAITAISTDNTKLVIDTTGSISDNLTIPANVHLCWYKAGCEITVADTKTLTINGTIEAPPKKLFVLTGTGAVAFGTLVDFVYSEWWGAIADDSTVCTAAIQAAMNTLKPVHLLPGTYHIADTLNFTADGVTVFGAGRGLTIVEQDTNAKTSFYNSASADTTRLWCRLENFKLVGGASLGANPAIDWKSMQFGILRNLWITGQQTAGCKLINLEAVWGTTEATYNLIEGIYGGLAGVGIDVGNGANTCWVRNCRFQIGLNNGQGIYLDASDVDYISNFSIENCSFEYPGNTMYGVYVNANTTGVRVLGCRFESLNSGIYVGATSNKNVTVAPAQNYFSSCTTNINYAASANGGVAVCRASVTFVASTGAITGRAHNLTVARNGAGDYTLSFVVAMPDATYQVVISGGGVHFVVAAKSTSAITFYHYGTDHSTKSDPVTFDSISVLVFGNT